jgi:site-specific DNA recombinase
MEKLHIYLRVSTESQITDGFGIENQKELGLSVSERLGMEPIIYDEGFGSSHTETIEHRPILTDLLFKIEEGFVKNLWVYQMDRLSRNDVVSFNIRQILKKNNVKLYVGSSNDYDLDNPTDKLMFTIMEGFSEFDNSIRTERLRRGKLSKIKKGGWKGGPPPFGYELIDGQLTPQSEESKWVRRIYEEYGSGKPIYQIRRILMSNGVLSRRKNVVWSDQSIRKILENTHYGGYYFYTDKKLNETIRCDVPQIVNTSLISECRLRLGVSSYSSNYQKHTTLLRDLLVCGHCGHKYGQRINKSKFRNHYYCIGNQQNTKNGPIDSGKVCTTDLSENGRVRSIFIDDTDELVWNTVVDVLEKSHLFKETFKEDFMEQTKSFGVSMNDRKNFKRRIKVLEKKISEVKDIMNGQLVEELLDEQSSQQFKLITEKFEEKKREYQTEIDELRDQIDSNVRTTKWVSWVNDYKDRIDDLRTTDMSVEERKSFLNGIVDHIEVFTVDKQSHRLVVHFNTPYVDDRFEWKDKGNPKKGYTVSEGSKDIVCMLDSRNRRTKK